MAKGLGRGVDALFSSVSEEKEKNENRSETLMLNPAILKPNPYQPRKEFDETALAELSASIKEHGIIQPVVVEQSGEGYFIIAGERRTRAAMLAGLTEIPVIVTKIDDTKKLEIALIENIQREDLNPIEEAAAYKQLMSISNLNQDDLAKRVGKSRPAVANALRLLRLPEQMQKSIKDGKISAGHARALLSVVNPADQQVLFSRIEAENISVRDAELQAANLNTGKGRINRKTKPEKPEQKTSGTSLALKDIEEQLIEAIGTKVKIKGSLDSGCIEIYYFSNEDLDSIYGKLKKKNNPPPPPPPFLFWEEKLQG